MSTKSILESLRNLMKDAAICGCELSAYIIYSSDAHQSEYTPKFDHRRQFISKFTGSAATVVVTQTQALLWTDGRYHLQAEAELDCEWTLMKQGVTGVPELNDWLCSQLPDGANIGTDPLLVAANEMDKLAGMLKMHNKNIIVISKNLVDIVWQENGKDDMPYSKIYHLEPEFSGESAKSKINRIQKKIMEKDVDTLFVYSLDSIAWLLNLRGSDVVYTPVFRAYAFLSHNHVTLFINVSCDVEEIYEILQLESLSKDDITILPYSEAVSFTESLSKRTNRIMMAADAPYAFAKNFCSSQLIMELCPVYFAKSIKNSTEIEGGRKAGIKDSAALCQYFGYLEDNVHSKEVTEVSGANLLSKYRSEMDHFVDLCCTPISSSGPNCAMNHYNPYNAKVPIVIDPKQMYLIDSGAHYKDGTTDITRTLHFTEASDFEKEAYTYVLKAHISMATTIFLEGVKGHSLDVMARRPLWEQGLDYLHGTGHGIGSFLCVHEGPQKIAHYYLPDHGLMEGMHLSNEPGYYEGGKFGIRLENMMYVVKVDTKYKFNDAKYCGFETISYIPFQNNLILTEILTAKEIEWVNHYYEQCLEKVSPLLEAKGWTRGLEWLKQNAIPLSA